MPPPPLSPARWRGRDGSPRQCLLEIPLSCPMHADVCNSDDVILPRRLFTEAAFEMLEQSTVPEILRCSMATIVLQLKVMGISNPLEFDFISAPSEDAFLTALDLLFSLEALDEKMGLTEEGRRLAQFPLDPKHCFEVHSTVFFGLCQDAVYLIRGANPGLVVAHGCGRHTHPHTH